MPLHDEGPRDLKCIGCWHFFRAQANIVGFDAVRAMMKRSRKVIPDHPKLTEIHLRVLIFSLVMPAMDLREAQKSSARS